MTYEMAVKILNRVRDGVFYPEAMITQALTLTGDYDESSENRPEPAGDRPGTQTAGRDGPEPSYGGTWSA